MANVMRDQCIQNVSSVLGRNLSAKESGEILKNLKNTLTRLSRSEPNWGAMSADDRRLMAAQEIAKQYRDNAKRAIEVLQKQALKQQEMITKKDRLAKESDLHAYKGLGKILDDVYRLSQGVRNEYLSKMFDTLNGIGSKYFGFVEDPADVTAFIQEAFGVDSGNAKAKAAWKSFEKVANEMRDRAIRAGADIGKLDYGYIPQSHDAYAVRKASKKLKLNGVDDMTAWVNFIKPLLDRSRYVDMDGNLLSDSEFESMLTHAYNDIITSGSPDADIMEIYKGLSEHYASMKKYQGRVIHFKDADAFMQYESMFGRGSLTGSLIGHVSKMANDIAILEEMGPKPRATYKMLHDVAEQEAKNASGNMLEMRKYTDAHGIIQVETDAMWRVLTGEANKVAIGRDGFANFMQGWRNLEMAGKLGKAFITSFSDVPTYLAASGFNQLGFMDSLKFFVTAYGKDWKDYATLNGIIADSIASDFNRWGSDNLGQGWTAKLTNASMQASFLNAFTDATRRAFSLNMLHYLGKKIATDWNSLDSFTRARLEKGRITENDWKLFQYVGTETYKGTNFLSVQGLRDLAPSTDLNLKLLGIPEEEVRQSVSKLLGYIVEESEMASLAPDLTMRAEATRGAQKGTFSGELARSFYLFKSFPFTFLRKHYERMMFTMKEGDRADQFQYLAWVVLGSTMFGALSLQTQNLLNGKDLQDTKDKNFWLNAMAKGGGLGILGDFLYNGVNNETNMYGRQSWVNFMGPVVGTTMEATDIVTGSLGNALYDNDVKIGAKALRLARSHMPFMNLWYAGTAIDRAIMNDIQESLSPGYLRRMETRQRRSTGQEYWWRPSETTPTRAPRMATVPQ